MIDPQKECHRKLKSAGQGYKKAKEQVKGHRQSVCKIGDCQNKQRQATVFLGLCKGCGLCIEKCPVKAISFSKTDLGAYSTPSVQIDPEKCTACGICEAACPDSALLIKKGANNVS